jgi:hypothetical protein
MLPYPHIIHEIPKIVNIISKNCDKRKNGKILFQTLPLFTLLVNRDNLSFVIAAASLADPVWYGQCAALAAFDQGRSGHFPIRPPLIPS